MTTRRQVLQGLAGVAAWGLSGAGPKVLWTRQLWADEVTKQLTTLSESPYNGEPQGRSLAQADVTPLELFYVRNHGPVPRLNATEFQLTIEGLVRQPLTLSLAELQQRFAPHSVEATLTCAGNRRAEMSAVKAVAGVQWTTGAIGNARWQGAALAELLRAAEIQPGAKHIWFEGADAIPEKDGSVAPFGGSIPLAKALSDEQGLPGALVAYQMNGQPLLPHHGFPMRTVVPGYIGARSVKWLKRIVVSDRPSPNHYLADAYKLVQTDSAQERATAEPIYDYVVNGAICVPESGAPVRAGKVRVAGYALPGGQANCRVDKVRLSSDGGKSWHDARLLGNARPFCWQRWEIDLPIAAGTQELILRVRDNQGHEQPKAAVWNLKGYLYNSWHRRPVTVTG